MKNTVNLTLIVFALAWCTSGWCEEKKLDPGVVNDWMRATVSSESSGAELKRVVYSSTLENWANSNTFYHVRYEVENSSCKRTLTLNFTDFHGKSFRPDWVKPIEDEKVGESFQIENPRILVKALKNRSESNDTIMDLDVEYGVQDGMPVLVVSNQRDVIRTLREFKTSDSARIRISAFEFSFDFRLDLEGFADKESWFHEHCPLDDTESKGNKEAPAS